MGLQKNKNIILYVFTFLFWGAFYLFLPVAGDDWTWGSSFGMNRLYNAFDGYNGRYVGNLLIILITRSLVARVIICSLVMLLLIYIMSKIFDNLSNDKNSTKNYLISFISVLILVLPSQIAFGDLQPFQIFGSTIGWLSGFTNYVVSSVLILVFYYFVTNKKIDGTPVCILLFAIGVISCLCVEHYTLFCLLFSFFIIVYRFYFYKKICKKSIAFLIGSFVGALIMFSNSSYRSMKGDASTKMRAIGFFGSFKQYVYYVFGDNANKTVALVFEIALFVIIAGVLLLFAYKTYKAVKNRNVSSMLPIICLVVMTVPLLFTNSGKEIYIVAPRCYFLQYFMLVIFIYNKLSKKGTLKKATNNKLVVCLAVLVLITGILYARLDYMGAYREKIINEQVENGYSTVEILEYPRSVQNTQWASNFVREDIYKDKYMAYYDIPQDTELKLIDNK